MGRLELPKTVGYDAPPSAINALSPELYEYLWVLQNVVTSGSSAGGGTIDATKLKVDHSLAFHLDADDHPQYLTNTRHNAIGGNPHGVTAADVGNEVAQWNASALQGQDVAPTPPADGQVLQWDDNLGAYVPTTPSAAPVGSFVELGVAAYNAITPAAGPSAGLLLLPSQALILGVFVKNVTAFPGTTGYFIGTQNRRDAWGACAPQALAASTMGGFHLANPIYTGTNPGALFFTAITGAFNGTSTLQVRVYYWAQPVFT